LVQYTSDYRKVYFSKSGPPPREGVRRWTGMVWDNGKNKSKKDRKEKKQSKTLK
jgi:hypothetical protein